MKDFYTVTIEATVTANSQEEARGILFNLIRKNSKVSSYGMTDTDIEELINE